MKVIHCLNNFLPKQVAGTEIYTQSLIKELKQRNIEALVLIPNFGKSFNESYIHENIRVIKYAEPSIVDRDLIMGRTIPEGLVYFKNIIETEMPSIVHFHVVGSGSNGISLRHVSAVHKMGIKIIMTMHLAGYTCKRNNLLYKNRHPCNGLIDATRCTQCMFDSYQMNFVKRNILYCAAVAAHKFNYDTTQWNNTLGTAIGFPFLIEQMKVKLLQLSAYCNKIVVLTHWYKKVLELNGVPLNKLKHIAQGVPRQQSKKSNGLQNGILKLVFVGRINHSKGLHILIEAIKMLPVNKISVDIYGQVDDERYASDCKAATSLMPNIQWRGIVAPKQMVKTLAQYHCLCLPSVICEMSPLVIQEAFAAGIPVIASDVYGNAEQIENGENGWIFIFNDSNDLKNKLAQLIDAPMMIENAAAKIKPVKSFEMVADEYEALYIDIITHPVKINK